MQRIGTNGKYLFYIFSVMGLVISICIISVILGLYGGGREVLRQSYWNKGTNVYLVAPESGMEADAVKFFDDNEKQVRREMPEVKAAMPVIEARGSLKSYKSSRGVDVIATGKNHAELFNIKIQKGRFLSKEDSLNKNKALVIDDITAYKLFGKVDAIGREVELNLGRTNEKYKVVGVVDNYNKNLENLYSKKIEGFCFIPESSYMEMDASIDKAELALFVSKSLNKEEYAKKIEHYFMNHGLGTPETSNYDQLKEVTVFFEDSLVPLILGALLSFILGCACFMNAIMLTVNQRKKEIVMAVLYGAAYKDIRDEVLYRVELAALGSGAAGVAIGTICSGIVGRYLNLGVGISLLAIAAAFGLSTLAGFIAALYPLESIKRIDAGSMIWN